MLSIIFYHILLNNLPITFVQFGFKIDSEKVLTIVQTICSILIILGLLNDPTENTKAYIPGVSDKLINKE